MLPAHSLASAFGQETLAEYKSLTAEDTKQQTASRKDSDLTPHPAISKGHVSLSNNNNTRGIDTFTDLTANDVTELLTGQSSVLLQEQLLNSQTANRKSLSPDLVGTENNLGSSQTEDITGSMPTSIAFSLPSTRELAAAQSATATTRGDIVSNEVAQTTQVNKDSDMHGPQIFDEASDAPQSQFTPAKSSTTKLESATR